jgi:hypothetical protein
VASSNHENDNFKLANIQAKGFTLKLPDGLSHHLAKIGVAKDFKYLSTWQELWK